MENLHQLLLLEHSKAQTEKIITWVGSAQKRFDALMGFVTGPDKRLAQRAAWPMSYIATAHPHFVLSHLPGLLALLRMPGVHDAVVRNTLRFLQTIPIPEDLQGMVMDLCFGYIQNIQEKAAVKAFALTILKNLSVLYPEILPEIRAVVESSMSFESAAFKVRARIFLT